MLAQLWGRGAEYLSDGTHSQQGCSHECAAPPFAATPNRKRPGLGLGGPWAGDCGARVRHPEVGGCGGGECAAGGWGWPAALLAGLTHGRAPGFWNAVLTRLVEGEAARTLSS